ncbi:Imm50 family immunity protein [Paraburkholderia azotifigens]|uniref:Imm50 family immunity protein n=1 Tax=Paraburkholderia azotifigens TaxID=2057004 RepID=A0A5C6V5I2_9BURK|nr:Imm50 family immunity protein [Paraburkholderia azotifigens]TXC80124.1 hypothetical protein FRZ40_38105 [Paraburkholderia azotifigens]
MLHWTDLLVDKRKLMAIYGVNFPSLDKVNVHEIIFHRDGPTVTFRVDLLEYPSSPPKKWIENEFNTAQIRLSCSDVKYSSLHGWNHTSFVASIGLNRDGDLITLALNGDGLSVCIKSSFLDVSSISAYINTRPIR